MRRFLLLFYTLLCLTSMALCQQNDFNWSKIDPELKKDIESSTKSDEMFRILVVMEEQYDPDEMENLTRDMDNETAREFVINEMQRFTGIAQANVSDVMRNQKANTVRNLQFFWIFNGFACESSADVISMLSKRTDIKIVCDDKKRKMIPDDLEPKPVQSQTKGNAWNVEKVNADDVWVYNGATGYTGNGVIVAVIDSGVNYNHTDISSNMWNGDSTYPYHGYDFVNNDNDPMDDHGHGTHCAGTVAGYGTNGTQTGIAPNAIIMALKALDDNGDGGSVNIIDAMEFALSHGADVLSMSLGAAGVGGFYAYRDAMITLKTARVAAAVAAGNEGDELSDYPVPYNVGAPGNCPPPYLHPDQTLIGGTSATISVGATNNNDQKASFSSIGPVTWADGEYIGNYNDYSYSEGSTTQIGLIRPDVVAPGVDITSLAYNSNTGYCEMSGTSMATPCVAGVIALMLEADPTLTPADIDRILETTAVKCEGETKKNNRTGSGRVDVLAAINAVLGNCSAPTDLTAIVNNNNVTLTWTAAEGVESYRIYRDNVMIESAVTGTSYTDSELALGDYTYYLRSNCSDESTSTASNTVIAEVGFPGNITATIGDLRYSFNTQKRIAQVIGPESGYGSGNLIIPSSVTYNNTTYIVTSIGNNAFYNCYGFTGSLTIPNSVTYIGNNAFDGCHGFAGLLTIPNSVISIGNNAFHNCYGLTGSLTIPNSVTSIGNNAFGDCHGFTGSLSITNSVTSIGNHAFYGCSGLTGSLTIPNSVTSIGNHAFYGCHGFTGSLTIPNSVTSIGNQAFYGCYGFTGSLTIPNSVTNIGDAAFSGCSGFTGSLTIPNQVTSIGKSAFKNCSGLTSLTIPNSVIIIDDIAFGGCSGLTSLTIGNSVTSIGYSAFSGCSGLTSLTIPNSVITIDYYAFSGCSGLTIVYWNAINVTRCSNDFSNCNNLSTVVFGDSVQTIPAYAFRECSVLTSLTIGNSLTSIGAWAFSGCSGLTIVYWNAINVTSCSNVFSNCNNLSTVVFGDSVELIPAFAFSECSGLTSLTIPNSVTSIGAKAFYGCTGLSGSLAIPNSVTSIGNSAFYGCSGLTGSLTIPNSVTNIGDAAFSGCSGFTGSLTIPNSMTSIGIYVFYGCSGLTSLTIPNSVTSIGYSAFSDCSGLTSLTIPNSVTSIGNSAFYGCSGLTSLTIPNSVTSIGNSAFYGCSSLTGSLTIPNQVTSIGKSAFKNCSGLTTVYWNAINVTSYPYYYDNNPFNSCTNLSIVLFGDAVETIPAYAFVDCYGLTLLTIPNSVLSIGYGAFAECSGLISLTIGDSVSSIGDYAFYECSGLTTVYWNAVNVTSYPSYSNNPFNNCTNLSVVVFGDFVETIPAYAFYGCSGFTSLTIPNSVTSLGNSAFENCNGLTIVYWNAINVTNCSYLFNNCTNLSAVVFGDSVETIPGRAFSGCTGLTSLTIPNSVTSIGDNAFSGCTGLISLTIPNSVTSIGDYAFRICTGLKSLTIPNSVASIGNHAFSYCSGLTTVYWNAVNVTSNLYGDYYFFNNCTNLSTVVFGDSVETIPAYAFRGCSGLTLLTIPNSVTTIGNLAFSGCSSLTSLTIPNSVTNIGGSAFYGCSGLTSLTIPNSVMSIGNSAFYECSGIAYIRTYCETCPIIYQDTFYGIDKYVSVQVPCGTQDEYKSAQYWSEFENIHETEYGLVVTQNDQYGGKVSVLEWADCEDNHCAILAEPSVGYTFNGWYVDDVFVTGSELYIFSLTEDVAYEARFSRNENHYIANGTFNTWSNPDTWDTGEVPTETSTVAIYKNIVVDVDANVSAMGVYDDNTITITPDVVLTVEDELVSDNASSIIIEYGGQIIHSNKDVMATVEKTIEPFTSDEDGWNLISFPLISNGTVASVTNMLSNEYDLFAYDEPSYTWINQKDENNSFTELWAGMGYLYANRGKAAHIPIGAKIGNGTSRTDCSPYNTNWKYSIAENLYLVSELEAAGISTSELGALCWYATNENGYQQSNITIWMANVSDTELTETSHNVSEMTLVYTGDMTPVIGWNEFVFNENTFNWDGTSNVLICVQRNNGAWNSAISWQAHDPGFAALSYKYTDNNAYDMTSETYSMTVSSTSRPNTIFQTLEQVGEYENYEPITLSFAGEIENGTAEVTVPLSYTSGNKLSGFNLVGNPFVHNVTSYDGYNVADCCYRINDAKTNLIVSNISNENPMRVGEGFFVKATGDNASITFNSQSRKSPDERGFVQLELFENDKIIDRLIVKKDGVPLKKMSLRGNHTELFARYDSERVSIVPMQGSVRPVSFKASRMGNYTISVNIENLDIDYLHLIDNFTGKDIDLLIEPQYTFVGASDDNESRFRLVFDKSANVNNSEIFAYQNGNEIIVSGNGTLQIFDVIGRMVATQPINGVETMYTTSLQTGVYIFRLLGESPRIQKIVVR